MKKLGQTLIVVAFIGTIGYFLRNPAMDVYESAMASFYPCSRPVTYTIGKIDPGFKVSKMEFEADIESAIAIWEKPMNKKLFEHTDTGDVVINLTYDYRQQATNTLDNLGNVIDSNKTNYDLLNNQYQTKTSQYTQSKNSLASIMATFQSDKTAYEQEVSYWNSRGGADKSEYSSLANKKAALEQQIASIQSAEDTLNRLATELNSTAEYLNQMARDLNVTVQTYNTVGASTGKEFNEGEYIQHNGERSIEIYQFDTKARLIRVLGHELGHALGLEHIDDPKAIMYRLNSSENEVPTKSDISQLKTLCKITN